MHLLVGGPARAWTVLLACEDWKKPEAFELNTCLWAGGQILFRNKWRNLATASLLLHCIDGCNWLNYWETFYFICISGSILNFSRIALLWKRLQLDSKTDLITKALILRFPLGILLFCWLHVFMDRNLQELLKLVSFLMTSNFFDN